MNVATSTTELQKTTSRGELVAAAVEQNRDIWVRMATRITSDVQDAEDAVQEAISRVLGGAGQIADADAAGRYLTRTVSHCAIDRVRARSRLTSLAETEEPGPRLAPMDPDQESRLLRAEDAAAERERLDRLLEELETLPEPQRQAVELLVLRQPPMKLREASELTGTPISTLHSRLQSAVDNLRRNLSETTP